MKLHIIHLPHRTDRLEILLQELSHQGIEDYELWDGVIDPESSKRGIARAHKRLVNFAKENQLPEILIGEDDLHFTDQGALAYFLQNRPEFFDIYLGGVYYGELNEQHQVTDFSGLTLYIIKAHFYDTFLNLPEDIDIDRALKGLGNYVVCNPFIVTQHNGYSDNVKKHTNYDEWLLNRTFYTKNYT